MLTWLPYKQIEIEICVSTKMIIILYILFIFSFRLCAQFMNINLRKMCTEFVCGIARAFTYYRIYLNK